MRAIVALLMCTMLLMPMSQVAFADGDGVDVHKSGSRTFEGVKSVAPDGLTGRRSTSANKHRRAHATAAPRKYKLSAEEFRAYHGLCNRMNQEFTCTTNPKTKKPTPAAMTLNLTRIARTLITKIRIPDPTPQVGPDPSVNQWKMTAVGYPLWLWTTAPTTVVDRVRAYGVTFTLRATWTSTHFDMGDGHHLTCNRTQPYTPTVKPGTASPTCGYTYLKASLPKGTYTVRATTNWTITWTALAMTGTIPASFTGTRQLPVGELNALVVG